MKKRFRAKHCTPEHHMLISQKTEKVNLFMEKMNLSLKSIYRLLMTNDFPIYSESVIDEKNRKGQTLLKFWQNLVASEFRCLPCGQIIWRNDGRRNRYVSNLCNRNPEMKFYPEYAKELASQISTATLLNQLQRFSVFLSGRNYKHDILLRRIRELMRLTQTDDPHVSHAIAEQIEDAIGWQDNDSNKSLSRLPASGGGGKLPSHSVSA